MEDETMRVAADLAVIPVGTGASLSEYVAACERVIQEAGLTHHLHASGTNIEGDWDAVMAVVKRCHEVVHELGAPRISTTLRIGTSTERTESIARRVRSVEEKLGKG